MLRAVSPERIAGYVENLKNHILNPQEDKLIGYARAPLECRDQDLPRFRVFSLEEVKKNYGFRHCIDFNAQYLDLTNQIRSRNERVHLIKWDVLQREGTEDFVYRPSSLFDKFRRRLFLRSVKLSEANQPRTNDTHSHS